MAFLVHGERFSSEKNPGIFLPRSIFVGVVSLCGCKCAFSLYRNTIHRLENNQKSFYFIFFLDFFLTKNAVAICPADPASYLIQALHFF